MNDDIAARVPETVCDRLTRLAAQAVQAPAAMLILDGKQPRVRSAFGGAAEQFAQEPARALSRAECGLFDFEEINGSGRKAFVAGVALGAGPGTRCGLLAVVDYKPRRLSPEERQALQDLAEIFRDEMVRRARLPHSAAVASINAGVVVTDMTQPHQPLIFINPGFTAATGYEPGEVLGHNCRFLQGPGTSPEAVEAIRAAIRERRGIVQEILNYRKDGTPFWNELTLSPVFDEAGRLVSFVGLQVDITARKQLDRLRDDLTHMLIHDLRSPLSSVMGALDFLEFGAKLPPKDAELLTLAIEGAAAVNEMITSLLDINRLEVGRMPLQLRPVELAQLIPQVLRAFAKPAGGRHVTLRLPGSGLSCLCDGDLIQRTLANLISNALKFSPPDGEVVVSAAELASSVSIFVSDHGPGIPPADLDRVFEKFGQVEAQRVRHSSGLGLTFCKLAVEAHGGRISVKSELGKGSTFHVELPKEPRKR